MNWSLDSFESRVLTADYFEQDTVKVARDLLGQFLVVKTGPEAGDYVVCKVVETEAYTGNDPACHAYQKNKGRAATLYMSPGTAYVYFIYGMYYCLNVVTEPEGEPGAILIRGLEPVYSSFPAALNTRGPGRLCTALSITKATHNQISLTDINSSVFFIEGPPPLESDIVTTTRIGITRAQEYPWRFYLKDNSWVSVTEKKRMKRPDIR